MNSARRMPIASYNGRFNNFRGRNQVESHNEEHWCDTCDKGFKTLELLENHKQQHQKCNIDGCQFIAHPKVITKHIQMQHSSGLYYKIAKLKNPEEINKWIEERKKKYPTRQNIEKKTAETIEKISRGEKLGLKTNRNNKYQQGKNHKSENSFPRKFTKNREINVKTKTSGEQSAKFKNNVRNTNLKHKPPTLNILNKNRLQIKNNKNPILVDPHINVKKLEPFTGIQNLQMDIEDNCVENDTFKTMIEDDDCIDIPNAPLLKEQGEPLLCNALSSLIGDYGSSDEENVKDVHLLKESTNKNKLQSSTPILQSKDHLPINQNTVSDDDSGPEEIKVIKDASQPIITSTSQNYTQKSKNEIKIEDGYKRRPIKKFRSKLPSTLLEKLLFNEIRKERNMVLQCVRYIIKNDFFDK